MHYVQADRALPSRITVFRVSKHFMHALQHQKNSFQTLLKWVQHEYGSHFIVLRKSNSVLAQGMNPHFTQQQKEIWQWSNFLCFWFRASLIYINNCPTRCNTKQSIYYSASSLYTFRMSTTPIIRSTQNCNYSLRYWSYFLCIYLHQRGQASLATLEGVVAVVTVVDVVTVLCTDDGCGWHPKHVEWTCRIINRLFCVASRWAIINTLK